MRGGFLVSTDPDLFLRASSALLALGATQAADERGDGVVQFTDADGTLFTIYERVFEGTEWEVREGSFTGAPGILLPDMRLVTACPFECRSPHLVARLVDIVAWATEAPTWVLDGDGVIWDGKAVDPLNVRL